MELSLLITRLAKALKPEADRLMENNKALDRKTAYVDALAALLIRQAERQSLTYNETLVLDTMRVIQKRTGKPVWRKQVIRELQIKGHPIGEHTVYRAMVTLTEKLLVFRPGGKVWAVIEDLLVEEPRAELRLVS
jgi:hypothetical protein